MAQVLTTDHPRTRDPRLSALRRVALVPAHNEEDSVTSVVEEINAHVEEVHYPLLILH